MKLPPVKVPKRLQNVDPLHSDEQIPERLTGKVGAFAPSHRWVPYNRLQGVDAGYITRLYSLKEIALRYGLSHNSRVYFRKHILPEPFDLVRRRNVSAHHWSRFTLMALDVVLKDLEHKGFQQFLSRFDEHIDNLHRGIEFMEEYYAKKVEEQVYQTGDEYGVSWDED